MKQFKILSIDAWRYDDGWTWNNWFHVGSIDATDCDNTRKLLKKLRDEGFLSDYSKGKVVVSDDQFNLVISDRYNGKPLFAIEYGSEI